MATTPITTRLDNGYQYMGDDDVNIFTLDGYYTYEGRT